MSGQASRATNLIATGSYVGATILVYQLLKPVNRNLSLLAALFSFIGCTISFVATLRIAVVPVNPLFFFGLHCLTVGCLIYRSTYLPRVVGALLAIGGLGWVTFVSPTLAKSLSPFNMFPGIVGEGTLSLWLIFAGVNAYRWDAKAGAQGG